MMPNSNKNLGKRLSDKEIQELSKYLDSIPDALSLEALDGFFTALICSPDMAMPSTYFSYIWGEDYIFDSEEELKKYSSYVLRHWNSIVKLLSNHRLPQLIIELVDGVIYGNEWAVGFMLGTSIGGEGWKDLIEDDDNSEFLGPIMALAYEEHSDSKTRTGPFDKEMRSNIISAIAAAVPEIYAYFEPYRQQASNGEHHVSDIKNLKAKVGRNEPCPCGSGLKFKKCCGKN